MNAMYTSHHCIDGAFLFLLNRSTSVNQEPASWKLHILRMVYQCFWYIQHATYITYIVQSRSFCRFISQLWMFSISHLQFFMEPVVWCPIAIISAQLISYSFSFFRSNQSISWIIRDDKSTSSMFHVMLSKEMTIRQDDQLQWLSSYSFLWDHQSIQSSCSILSSF